MKKTKTISEFGDAFIPKGKQVQKHVIFIHRATLNSATKTLSPLQRNIISNQALFP